MPTYYNGQEITPTSIMSGVSLDGRSEITIGGSRITLASPPPRMRLTQFGSSNGTSGFPDPQTACMISFNGSPLTCFVGVDKKSKRFQLFNDEQLTTPLRDGWYWSKEVSAFGEDPNTNEWTIQVVGMGGDVGQYLQCGMV